MSTVCCAPFSPSCENYALKKKAEDNKKHFRPEVIDTILNNIYVDDCLKSSTQYGFINDEGLSKSSQLHVREEASNSRNGQPTAAGCCSQFLKQTELRTWKHSTWTEINSQMRENLVCEDDNITFNVTIKPQPDTQRGILSIVSSIYDPLGFLAPFTLPAKLLLQELCKINYGYEDRMWGMYYDEISKMFSKKSVK